MVATASELKIAASRSTLSVVALSRAGSLAALLVASEAADIPRPWHHVPWVRVTSLLQEAVSVVDSEVGLMVDAVASGAAEAAAVSRTEEDSVEVEVASDMEGADSVAVTEAEEDLAATVDQTVGMAHHHQMLQLDQEVPDLASKAHHLEVSVPEGMAKARLIAMDLLLEAQVGMAAADHLMKTVDQPAATGAVIVAMATVVPIVIVEDIVQHKAEATWSQFVHASSHAGSHAKTVVIARGIQEITTWV